MRHILLAVPLAAAVAGTLTIYAASKDDTVDPNVREYLLVAQRAPDRLQELISAVLPACLSDADRPYIADSGVADLAVRTVFKSGTLMAEGKTAAQSSEEIVPYVQQQARPLSPAQKETYLNLMKGGHMGRDTLICFYPSVTTASASRVQLKSITWNVRG